MAKKKTEQVTVGYADGTSERFNLPTPKQMADDERLMIESMPDVILQMCGVTKKALLKSHDDMAARFAAAEDTE
jgi:hypothetical protein